MTNFTYKYLYLLILFVLSFLSNSVTYAKFVFNPLVECKKEIHAKPHVIESNDGKLRYIQLPKSIVDLKIDNVVYNHSGLYLTDGTSEPVWKINEYFKQSEDAISDDGTFVAASDNTDHGIRFYKHGELIKGYKPWTLVIDERKGGIVFDTPYYTWLKNTKFYPSKNLLFLKTIDDVLYVFDITAGEITAATGKMLDATESLDYHKIENLDNPGQYYPLISADLLEYYKNEEDSIGNWSVVNNENYSFSVSIEKFCADILAENYIDHNAIIKLSKDKPKGKGCKHEQAGYGKSKKGVCFDMVSYFSSGPLMVVVPSNDEFQNGFAISHNEISIGEYTKYCALSKKCEPVKDKDLQNEPLRNITLQEAQSYAQWLSEITGNTYRLPTSKEWEYAATAKGNENMKKDFNCRVVSGDQITKGADIVNVKDGVRNDWGLINFIGNVQEWVIDDDKVSARGGAYTDPHEECDISLSRPHTGNADEITGFRLVLEEVLSY